MSLETQALDVCAGIGASAYGLKAINTNISIPISIEINKVEQRTYIANHHPDKMYDDLYAYSPSFHDVDLINFILATPPCQDFTTMNIKRNTTSKKSELMYRTMDLIDLIRPKHFIIENVRGFQRAKDRYGNLYLTTMLHHFRKLHYNIWHGNLNAFNYGVPQSRNRYFILGSLNKIPHKPSPTVRIGYKEILDSFSSLSSDTHHSNDMIQKFQNLPFNKWTKLDPNKKYNTAYRLDHTKSHLPAPTILNMDKVWIIWKNRVLNIDEIKTLQTLPINYILEGTKKDKYRGLGNVLPSKLAFEVAKQFFDEKRNFTFYPSGNILKKSLLEDFI